LDCSTPKSLWRARGSEIGWPNWIVRSAKRRACQLCVIVGAIGKGLARSFMTELLDRAWTDATKRVWLHTCTLDGPTALSFYRKCGFRPYKRAIEVADDPRLRAFCLKTPPRRSDYPIIWKSSYACRVSRVNPGDEANTNDQRRTTNDQRLTTDS